MDETSTSGLTVAEDQEVRLWNATNGQPLTAPLKWNGNVSAAEFFGSGIIIAVVAQDFSVRVWECPLWQTENPPWIGPLAEAIVGQRSRPNGIVEAVPATEFLSLRQKMLATAEAERSTLWARRF